ncbi:MAG TPA: hypothetical protein PKN64_01420, partial [Casimicrobium sp.]|nr:hypothetical protein [Casimicrobium sp.]
MPMCKERGIDHPHVGAAEAANGGHSRLPPFPQKLPLALGTGITTRPRTLRRWPTPTESCSH